MLGLKCINFCNALLQKFLMSRMKSDQKEKRGKNKIKQNKTKEHPREMAFRTGKLHGVADGESCLTFRSLV